MSLKGSPLLFQFFEYMMQQAIKTDNKVIIENKSKFVLCHASSGKLSDLRVNIYFYKFES
jgi:hypothetical protein